MHGFLELSYFYFWILLLPYHFMCKVGKKCKSILQKKKKMKGQFCQNFKPHTATNGDITCVLFCWTLCLLDRCCKKERKKNIISFSACIAESSTCFSKNTFHWFFQVLLVEPGSSSFFIFLNPSSHFLSFTFFFSLHCPLISLRLLRLFYLLLCYLSSLPSFPLLCILSLWWWKYLNTPETHYSNLSP